MAVSLIRLEQVRKTDDPDDTLGAATIAGVEATAVDHLDFLKGVLSQFKRIIHGADTGNWHDDIGTVFTTDTSLKALHARATLEAKYALANRLNVTDITVASAAKSAGSISAVSKAELVDSEEFTINDGTRTVHFIFDQTGTYVPGGPGYDATHVRLNVSGCTDADSVVAVIVAAINLATIDVTASTGTSPTVDLLHDVNGANNYPMAETVLDTDFTVTGMANGAGNVALLTTGTKPDKNIAISVSNLGAVTAQLATAVGIHSLGEIAASNPLRPKNLVYLFNGDTGDAIVSSDRRVYGLLQVGVAATDGNAFGVSGNDQGQLSFVRANATNDDLEACPAADITGQKVIYAFGWRENLKDLPEEFFRGDLESADPQPGVSVSLDSAYDGGQFMTVDGSDVDIRLANTKSWVFRAGAGGDPLVTITRNDSAADELQLDVDILDVNNATDANFSNGAIFDSGTQALNVGVTAGQVDSTALELEATTGDLNLKAALDVNFTTDLETSGIDLDDATTGKISTLWSQSFASISAAIKYAGDHGGVDMTLKVTVLSGNYAQGDNIPGAVQDVTANPIDMNTVGTVTQLVFLNGRLLHGGNGTTKNDVYAGTTPASGDIKVDFAKGVKTGDVIISAVLKQ